MEMLRQVLEDKEKEISDAKDRLRQVKDEAIREYHDSNTLLAELGGSFAEGFGLPPSSQSFLSGPGLISCDN